MSTFKYLVPTGDNVGRSGIGTRLIITRYGLLKACIYPVPQEPTLKLHFSKLDLVAEYAEIGICVCDLVPATASWYYYLRRGSKLCCERMYWDIEKKEILLN